MHNQGFYYFLELNIYLIHTHITFSLMLSYCLKKCNYKYKLKLHSHFYLRNQINYRISISVKILNSRSIAFNWSSFYEFAFLSNRIVNEWMNFLKKELWNYAGSTQSRPSRAITGLNPPEPPELSR